jgi:hypothetical protein
MYIIDWNDESFQSTIYADEVLLDGVINGIDKKFGPRS